MKRIVRPTDIRRDPRREVHDEIGFHLEMRTREFIEQGMSPEEARRSAIASFGDVPAIEAELRVARADRDRGRARRDWFRGTWLDLRHAARSLRKHPVFAVAAILTIALGIGATVSIFTVVNGVLLRPLPYAEPGRLTMVWLHGSQSAPEEIWPLSAGFYRDLLGDTLLFSGVAGFRSSPQTLGEGQTPETIPGARVHPSLFTTLGVRPMAGRAFSAADTVPSASPVAMISHSLWQRRFGGAPDVVGRLVTLNGRRTSIVGIMPPGFAFPRGAELPSGLQFGQRTEVWTPLAFSAQDLENYGTLNLAAVGRIADGVSVVQARSRLDDGVRRVFERFGVPQNMTARLVTLRDQAAAPVERGLLIILAGVGLLLLICCFNVANLLLTRTAERARELAVRMALGARRSRVAWQLIAENVLLAMVGGVLGVLVAMWDVRVLLSLVPGSLPRADDVQVDWRVLVLAFVLSVVCGVIFGLVSAFAAGRSGLHAPLYGSGTRASANLRSTTGRRALVTIEVAFSLVLLVGSGLLVRSFIELERVDPGFEPDRAVTANLLLRVGEQVDFGRDGPEWHRVFTQLTQRIAQAPGVDGVGATSALPLSGTVEGASFTLEGAPAPAPGNAPRTDYVVVAGDYFKAAGISLVQGRTFDSREQPTSTPVAIINRALAEKYFRDVDPIGKRLDVTFDFTEAPREIIGVVDDVKMGALSTDDWPTTYVPHAHMPYPFMEVVVRSGTPTSNVLAVMRRELAAIDPSLALSRVRTLNDVFAESLARQRFSLLLIGAFAWSALGLSLLGLYGVVALGVQQRRRELGVRLALGARLSDVRRLVLREGLVVALVGVVLGVPLAMLATRSLDTLLFRVSPLDVVTFAVVAMIVTVTALAASYIPARQATRVAPTESLRE
jgi:predicted permease